MGPLKNARHEAFALAIVAGKSGREAYQGAGYKKVTDRAADACASRLLTFANVASRIAELKTEVAETAVYTARQVIEELGKIAFANMADYMRVGAEGDPCLNFGGLTAAQTAALGEVTVEDFKDGRGEDARDVRRVKFKLWDKRAALVDIGNHLGLFKRQVEKKVEHSGQMHLMHSPEPDPEKAAAEVLEELWGIFGDTLPGFPAKPAPGRQGVVRKAARKRRPAKSRAQAPG